MSVSHTIDPSVGLVAYSITGSATAAELCSFVRSVLTHPDFSPGFRFLGDRRQAANVLDTPYVRAVALALGVHKERLGRCRWGVVVGSPAEYGMIRMLGALAAPAEVCVRPFYAPREAASWLELPADYCPPLVCTS